MDDPIAAASDSAASVSLDDFFTSLSQSGLLTPQEMARIRERSTSDPAVGNLASVIDWLIKEHKLTTYQAQVLARGQRGVLILGNYVILEKLGQGGMGTVFKARHRRMNRLVALKVLPQALASVPEAIARFQREVQAAASLQHPNIAAAYDADESAGVHFLVMEHVDGPTLAACVKARGALPVAAAVRLAAQAARGLAAAHAAGIVHRDIKPSNLMVNRQGVLKVLDLGLAQMHGERSAGDSAAEMTQTGRVMGTVDYMSPEQARDAKSVDHRADAYSLGCTLYFLVTGSPPAPPGSAAEKLLWHQTENPPSLEIVCPRATPRLAALAARLMAKRPEDRPASMAEIADELERCLAEFPAGEAELAIGDIALATEHTSSTLDGSGRIHATHRELGRTRTSQTPVLSAPVIARAGTSRSRLFVYACGTIGAVLLAAIVALPMFSRSPSQAPGRPVLPAAEALLIVEVIDGPAEVYLNGHWMGRAGDHAGRTLDLKVPPGLQLVQIKRDGFELLEKRIEARTEQPFKLAVDLNRIEALPIPMPPAAPAVHAAYERLLTWVFRNGGSLTAITGKGQQLTLTAASILPGEPLEIIAIRMDGTGIRNAELTHLREGPGVRELSLANTTITDEGLKHLEHLQQLTHLNLGETAVTSEGLAHVARLAALVELDLQKTKVTNPGLTRLAGLTNLQRLYLSDTLVNDVGIQQLGSLPALERVTLHGTGLSEEGHQKLTSARPDLRIEWDGADLERNTALRLLDRGVTLQVVDRDGRIHQSLRGRESLPPGRVAVKQVDATTAHRFGDEDLKSVALLPEIESLSLAGTAVTPQGLAHLHGLTTLKTLDLGPLRLPTPALAALKKSLTNCQITLKEPPDAEVAKLVIAAGGKVSILTQGAAVVEVATDSQLPPVNYWIRSIAVEGITAIDDAAVARFSDLPDLESLFLGGTSVTDDGIAHLASCRSLVELSLGETAVTAAGVGALSRLPSLERLYLAETKIGGEGARRLAAFPQLTHLSLQGVQLADDDLALLKRLERLEWLDVSGTPISDAAASHLSQLTTLRHLNVTATAVSDAGLEELQAALADCRVTGDPLDPQRQAARWVMQSKGTITLETGQLTSAAELPRDACRVVAIDLAEVPKLDSAQLVKHLGSCVDLVSLNLSDTSLRAVDLKFLAGLTRLRELRLANLPVSDSTVKLLAGHARLETLDVRGTSVTGAALQDLSQATDLKQLLMDNTLVDEQSFAALKAFPKLEALSVAASKGKISDAGLVHIEKLTALKSIDLRNCDISDAGLARIASLTALEELNLEGTAVTSAGIGKLSGLTKLRRLNLAQTRVTDDVTTTLAQLKQLKSINLARTTVSAESIRQLQTALPGCAILAPARPPRDPNAPGSGFGEFGTKSDAAGSVPR